MEERGAKLLGHGADCKLESLSSEDLESKKGMYFAKSRLTIDKSI